MLKLIIKILLILTILPTYGQINNEVPFKILKGHPYKIMYLNFSSDGKYLASCGWDNTIRVWDMTNFSEKRVLKEHSDVVWTSVISNDDRFLASGSQDASFILWDFNSGDLIHKVREFPQKARMFLDIPDAPDIKWTNSVSGIAFNNDNTILAAGSTEGKIRIYGIDSLKLLHTLTGHNHVVITILFTANNELMISTAQGKEIIIWDTDTFEPIHIIKDKNANTCQLIKDEKYLLSAGNCIINIYDISNGVKVRSFPVQCGLQNAQLTSNGKYLATCGEDHTARIYDFETGKEIWCYTNTKPEVGYCCISPNEKYLVVGIPEGDILIWEISELVKNK